MKKKMKKKMNKTNLLRAVAVAARVDLQYVCALRSISHFPLQHVSVYHRQRAQTNHALPLLLCGCQFCLSSSESMLHASLDLLEIHCVVSTSGPPLVVRQRRRDLPSMQVLMRSSLAHSRDAAFACFDCSARGVQVAPLMAMCFQIAAMRNEHCLGCYQPICCCCCDFHQL